MDISPKDLFQSAIQLSISNGKSVDENLTQLKADWEKHFGKPAPVEEKKEEVKKLSTHLKDIQHKSYVVCLECGEHFKTLAAHLRTAHEYKVDKRKHKHHSIAYAYAEKFGLPMVYTKLKPYLNSTDSLNDRKIDKDSEEYKVKDAALAKGREKRKENREKEAAEEAAKEGKKTGGVKPHPKSSQIGK